MPRLFLFVVISVLCLFASEGVRAEYRLGAYLGFGGSGIKTVSTISNTDVEVERSDSPGIFGIAYEYLTSDSSSISIDHTRGVHLSPFSSGVGFTGVTWRWFLWGKAPSIGVMKEDASYLLVARRTPFVGLATGIANGTISRENDIVPSVTASGVFFGFHGGVDYQTVPGKFLRVEALYSMTPESSGLVKSSLSQFSLHSGLYFIF